MRIFAILVALANATGFVCGQTPASGLSISGSISDPSSASVAGAKVTLRRAGGPAKGTATADAAGVFRFDAVVAGDYEIEIRHEGFQTAIAHVRVGSRSPAPLKIVLTMADLRQAVTVAGESGQVSTEAGENLNAVTLNQQTLESLPVFDQDYIATMSRFLDAGAIGTGGVTIVVDGLESTRVPVSPSAIREVKINQDPYSSEYSRPGRGRIEIITKPGSSEYHGTVNFIFRDSALNARDPFAITRAPEQRRIFEGSLTGPLGHSKSTSFVVTANRQEEDLQAVVFALGPSGPIDENAPTPQRNTEISGSVNHLFGQNQLVSFRGIYTDRTMHNQGVGGFTLPEAGADFEDREDLFYFNHRGLIKPKLLNQFRMLVFGRQHTTTKSLNPGPKIVVQDAFTGGGAQADRLQTENHFTFTEIVSYSTGKHSIRTGINVPDISRRGLDDYTNFGGTYTFATLQDYQQHQPFSLVQQQGEGHLFFWEKVVGGFIQDEFRLRPNLQLTAGVRYDWQNYFHDNNNISPRFSFAYAPGNQPHTVIRGGAGVFYDRTGPQPIFDLLRYDGNRLLKYIITDPSYPYLPIPGLAQPPSVVRLDPTVKIPVTIQYGAGVERQLAKSTFLTVNYSGMRGINLFRSRDVNAPLPPYYLARPDPRYSQIRQIESSADLESQSLEVSLRGNVTRYFSGLVQYTLSRAYNNVGGARGINTFPADNWNLNGEWARADFDARHRLNLLGNFTPGKGFNLGVALALNTGMPYSMTTGRDDNHDGLANDRPAGVPRNSLQGPGYAGFDLRWSRDFFLVKAKGEKGPAITPAIDAFNVLNRVNYAGFVGNLSSPFFGKPVAANPPRPAATFDPISILNKGRIMRTLIAATVALGSCMAPAFGQTLKQIASFDLPGTAGKRFDYLTIDYEDHYLLSAHLGAGILYVIDLRTNKLVKAIPDVSGIEGVEYVPSLKKAYTSDSGDNKIGVVDLKSMTVIKKLPTEAKPDGSAYAAPFRKVYVSDERGKAEAIVDVDKDEIVKTLKFDSATGMPQYDPVKRKIYVNLQDDNIFAVIDPATDEVVGRYPVGQCQGNHGMTLDAEHHRAFLLCEKNHLLTVFDVDAQKPIAFLAIPAGADVAKFDPGLGRVYVASSSGFISVFQEDDPNHFRKLEDFPVQKKVHSLEVDVETHRVYAPEQEEDGVPVARMIVYDAVPAPKNAPVK